MDWDFSIIDEAGLTQREFGQCLSPPVSRVTVSNWARGKAKPGKHVRDSCRKLLTLLRISVKRGDLPAELPNVYKDNMDLRLTYIKGALRAAVAHAKQAKRGKARSGPGDE